LCQPLRWMQPPLPLLSPQPLPRRPAAPRCAGELPRRCGFVRRLQQAESQPQTMARGLPALVQRLMARRGSLALLARRPEPRRGQSVVLRPVAPHGLLAQKVRQSKTRGARAAMLAPAARWRRALRPNCPWRSGARTLLACQQKKACELLRRAQPTAAYQQPTRAST